MAILLETEQKYIEQLNKICLLLSELKEKNKNSDFTELLTSTQRLVTFHQDFYKKIETEDTEEILSYLTTEETKGIYINYFKHLNQRQATLHTPSVQKILNDQPTVDIFKSPLEQLNDYKTHFNNIPNLANTQLLLQANQLLDTLIHSFLHLDTTHVIDMITKDPIDHYQLESITKPLLDHSFYSMDFKKDVRLVLTENYLLFYADNQLLFPSFQLDSLDVRSLDELTIQLIVNQKRTFSLKAGSKGDHDMWLGPDLSDCPLEQTVHRLNRKTVKTNDLFCYFQDPSGEVSSVESSDEETWNNNNKETMMENTKPLEPKPITSLKQPEIVTQRKSFIRSVFSAVSSPQSKKTKSTLLTAPVIDSPARGISLHHQSSNSSISSGHSIATPPLSRSGSPGSSTPVSQLRNSTSYSSDDLNKNQSSPPKSPDTIKQVIHKNDQCQVFHWKDETWHASEESSILEVRQTYSHRPCVTVHMKKTGQMYLNAWISKDMSIQRISETDINLTIQCPSEEHYLIHCTTQEEADRLDKVLKEMHLLTEEPSRSISQEDLAKSLQSAIECKCKLYLNSSSSKWRSFGSVHLKVSQHSITKKMHLAIESHKGGKTTQLVSAMVQSRNVERLGSKQISLLFNNEKTSVVYMVKVREESMADQIIEYLKDKNAEHGW